MRMSAIRSSRRTLLLSGLAVLLSASARGLGAAAAADETLPPAGKMDYRVLREGEEIGTHTVDFEPSGDGLEVETHIDVALTAVGIAVFRFKHDAREVWAQGRLQSVSARTDDDGTDRAVEMRAEGDALRVTYNGKVKTYPGPLLPSSLWHPATVRQTVLFDEIRGKPRRVAVADRGETPVTVGGSTVVTHRYAISGELVREVWYGPNGHIVQVTFPAKDGSTITILRRA